MCFLGRRKSVVTAKFGYKKGKNLEFVQDSWQNSSKVFPYSGDLIDAYTLKIRPQLQLDEGCLFVEASSVFSAGGKSERGKGK